MSAVKKVIISDFYDGFSIDIFLDDGTHEEFTINQEDTKEGLIEVFKMLGIKEVRYQEVY